MNVLNDLSKYHLIKIITDNNLYIKKYDKYNTEQLKDVVIKNNIIYDSNFIESIEKEKLQIETERKAKKDKEDAEKKAKKEMENKRKMDEKLKKIESEKKSIISNTLIDKEDNKDVNIETIILKENKRFKPYFKVSYKIGRNLTNITYTKTLKKSIEYIDETIISFLKLSNAEYKKNIKIQDLNDKDLNEYETDDVIIRTIIIDNFAIIPNMLKAIGKNNKIDKYINVNFDTNIYNQGEDLSSIIVFDKTKSLNVSVLLNGDEDILKINKYDFDIKNVVLEVAERVEVATEYYDRPMINYILFEKLDFIIDKMYNEKKRKESYAKYKESISNQLNHLLNGLADLNYKKNDRTITFKPSEDNYKGRKYAVENSSYQSLARILRHLIGGKYYIDLDMKNCHFNICKYLIESKDYLNKDDFKNIINYANDRTPYYNAIKKVFKDDKEDNFKQMYLSILFNEDFKAEQSKYKDIASFNNMVNEIKKLQDILYNNDEYKHHIVNVEKIIKNEERIALKKGEKYDIDEQNITGRVLSRILQEIENSILEAVICFLKSNDINYSGLQYDGLQLLKPDRYKELGIRRKKGLVLDDNFLITIQNEVKNKLNIDMPFSYKCLDTDIIIPETYIYSYEREYLCINNETDIENLFINTNRHILNIESKTNFKYIFDKETNIWYYEPKEFKKRVKNVLKNQNIYSLDYENDPSIKECIDSYLSGKLSVYEYNNIFKKLLNYKLNRFDNKLDIISKMVNENNSYGTDDFDYKINNSTIGKICFLNGVYFCDAKTFKPYPVPNVYSTTNTGRKYIEKNDTTIKNMDFIIERFEDSFFDENKDLLKELFKCLSRQLSGHYRDKVWNLLDSYLRNSGKGNMVDLLKKGFGDYITDFVNSYFAVKSVGDELKDNSSLLDLRFCRVGVVQEPPKGKNIKQDGAKIKSHASGGDALSARFFNTSTKISFVPHLTYTICCNKGIDVECSDVYANCLMIDYDYTFDDDKTLDALRVKPKKLYFGKDIKDLFGLDEYIDAFVHIILDNYDNKPYVIPQKIKDNIKNKIILTGKSDGAEVVKDFFEITSNTKHRLSMGFFDFFKKEIKNENSNYDILKYLPSSEYKMGLNRLTPFKKMRKCLNEFDYDKSVNGFEGIWFKNVNDEKYLINYMKSIELKNDVIRNRLAGICSIDNNSFSSFIDDDDDDY